MSKVKNFDGIDFRLAITGLFTKSAALEFAKEESTKYGKKRKYRVVKYSMPVQRSLRTNKVLISAADFYKVYLEDIFK